MSTAPSRWANFDRPGYARWLVRAFAAEFLGSLILILFQSASAESLRRPIAGAPATGTLIGDILGHAFGAAVPTFIFAHITTAVFNPALALGLWFLQRFDLLTVVVFTIAQVLGSFAASGLLLASLGTTRTGLGIPMLGVGISTGRGILMETGAGAIMFGFFAVTYLRGRSYRYLLAYHRHFWGNPMPAGMAALMAFMWNGAIESVFVKTIGSGPNPVRQSLPPATPPNPRQIRWLGPAILTGTYADWPVWIVAPYFGVIVGMLIYGADVWFLRPLRHNSPAKPLKSKTNAHYRHGYTTTQRRRVR